jgi:hypothetical protein
LKKRAAAKRPNVPVLWKKSARVPPKRARKNPRLPRKRPLRLLPSLPQALLAPTSPRGLALGLVSLAVLALGVRLRWLAPFVAGAVLVGLLLLVQLGPVAVALPRWILIAAAGVSMLGVGMTWESRVRDGRAAARWIGAMR